ncbi:MAG TPA: hypothetical protein VJ860_07325 [Polyangia bacterium]|jgi:hypothetical protein|nr:hypothetical protein [Polyangia bacterium]
MLGTHLSGRSAGGQIRLAEPGLAGRWAWRPTAGGFPDAEKPPSQRLGTDNPQGLQFTEPAIAGSPGSLFEWGTVVIDLGPEVFARWAAGGSLGAGIASTSGTKVILSTEGAQLHNILLLSEDMFTIQASFEPRAAATDPDRSSVDVYRLDIAQFDETDGDEREVGGCAWL